MARTFFTFFALVLMLSLGACRNSNQSVDRESEREGLKEAKLLSISQKKGYTKVEIINPWDTTTLLQTYLLVPRDSELPNELPEGTVVRTPVQNVLVYSSVHSSVMDELGASSAVRGVCDAQYFNDKKIATGLANGTITNCGNSMQPTIEKVIQMNPDAILLSPYQNASYGQIEKLKIPIIQCADYMEFTPLGRAEWIKFYGELLGERDLADKIYNKVVADYNNVREMVSHKKLSKPVVLTENVISGIWNVPGGQSYMAQFIKDAGGNYPWADDKNTGSLTLDFNQVLVKAQNADIWLLKSPAIRTLADLKASYPLNEKIKAYQTGNVYVCDTNTSHFFDRFPFHPEVLLMEYFKIFHPDQKTDYQLQFFKRIAQ